MASNQVYDIELSILEDTKSPITDGDTNSPTHPVRPRPWSPHGATVLCLWFIGSILATLSLSLSFASPEGKSYDFCVIASATAITIITYLPLAIRTLFRVIRMNPENPDLRHLPYDVVPHIANAITSYAVFAIWLAAAATSTKVISDNARQRGFWVRDVDIEEGRLNKELVFKVLRAVVIYGEVVLVLSVAVLCTLERRKLAARAKGSNIGV